MTRTARILFEKDPNAIEDFTIDWSDELGNDTISTSDWVDVDSGITVDSDSQTATQTVVWLSGGTVDVKYFMTNRITTVGGRTFDRTIAILVKEK